MKDLNVMQPAGSTNEPLHQVLRFSARRTQKDLGPLFTALRASSRFFLRSTQVNPQDTITSMKNQGAMSVSSAHGPGVDQFIT
jgi:hypothetical protein